MGRGVTEDGVGEVGGGGLVVEVLSVGAGDGYNNITRSDNLQKCHFMVILNAHFHYLYKYIFYAVRFISSC